MAKGELRSVALSDLFEQVGNALIYPDKRERLAAGMSGEELGRVIRGVNRMGRLMGVEFRETVQEVEVEG